MVAEFRSGVSRVKYPLDVDVIDASILLNPDGLAPKEQALQLVGSASEDYETALSVIKAIREYLLSVGIYKMGPYIDFRGRVKSTEASQLDFIGEHGEHIVEILSQLFATQGGILTLGSLGRSLESLALGTSGWLVRRRVSPLLRG